jgi:hypothetical protein
MKKVTILMGILLAGSYALAQDTGSSTDPSSGSSSSGMSGSSTSEKAPASERSDSSSQTLKTKGKVTAEVISSDETSKTITLRPIVSGSSAQTESVTLPVEGKAVASLKSLQSGEQVSVTCRSSQMSSGGSTGMVTGSSGSTGSEVGSKAGSAAGSAVGVGSSTGSAAGAAAGSAVESALTAHNCASVTEISKVKASAPAPGQ